MSGRDESLKLTAQHHEELARFSRMVERHLERVGRAIELRRLELDLSRPQLARLIPVADKTVERWEKGQSGGADAQLDRVAEVMNTTSQAMLAAALDEERAKENGAVSTQEPDAGPLAAIQTQLDAIQTQLVKNGEAIALLLDERTGQAADDLGQPGTPESPQEQKPLGAAPPGG